MMVSVPWTSVVQQVVSWGCHGGRAVATCQTRFVNPLNPEEGKVLLEHVARLLEVPADVFVDIGPAHGSAPTGATPMDPPTDPPKWRAAPTDLTTAAAHVLVPIGHMVEVTKHFPGPGVAKALAALLGGNATTCHPITGVGGQDPVLQLQVLGRLEFGVQCEGPGGGCAFLTRSRDQEDRAGAKVAGCCLRSAVLQGWVLPLQKGLQTRGSVLSVCCCHAGSLVTGHVARQLQQERELLVAGPTVTFRVSANARNVTPADAVKAAGEWHTAYASIPCNRHRMRGWTGAGPGSRLPVLKPRMNPGVWLVFVTWDVGRV
ncbi:hypothetical protein CB1_000125011 [Camelus ferus]|nr:hypothetical protein CB1_000125011 [Camelus ferus]